MAGPIDFGFNFGALFVLFALLALAGLAFVVWMLVDAIQRPPEEYSSPDAKTWWIVGLVIGLATSLPAIAVAIAYYVVVRRPGRVRREAVAGSTPAPPAPPPGQQAAAPPPPPTPGPPANCRNCGAKIVAGARFCHSCGAPAT